MRQFYQIFPNRYTLRSELSWSHYRVLYLPTEEELKAELIRERELIEREIENSGGGGE